MTRSELPESLEQQLARAVAARAAADTALRTARSNRQAAQADINRIHTEMSAQRAKANRERWTDPVLVAQIAEAEELLRTATAERDRIHAELLAEYQQRARLDETTAREAYGKNQVGFVVGIGPRREVIATQVQEDQRYTAANERVRAVKALHFRLVRQEQRSVQLREHQASVAARARKRDPISAALARFGVRSDTRSAETVEMV